MGNENWYAGKKFKKKSYTETLSRQLTWTTNVFYMLDFRLVEDYSNSTSYLMKLK
jgi:hypothetical protein